MTDGSLPPGPGPAPLNLLGWTLRPIPLMERCRRRYGERFTVDMGPPEGKWIFLTQPDEIREMFTAPADVLHPGEGARVLEYVVGPRSVLLLDGGEHLAQRKLMLPAFHGERMRALDRRDGGGRRRARSPIGARASRSRCTGARRR